MKIILLWTPVFHFLCNSTWKLYYYGRLYFIVLCNSTWNLYYYGHRYFIVLCSSTWKLYYYGRLNFIFYVTWYINCLALDVLFNTCVFWFFSSIDLRAELLRFHARYYSANAMRLVVLGTDLDSLQKCVEQSFGSIINHGNKKDECSMGVMSVRYGDGWRLGGEGWAVMSVLCV